MALRGPFCIQNKVLVGVNRNDELFDHLSKQVFSQGIKTLKIYADVITRLRNTENLNSSEKTALAPFLSSNRRALANLMMKSGDRDKAKRLCREAFVIDHSLKSLFKYILVCSPVWITKNF